ncbi:hypothetical protein FZD47_26255, partial [Bacillus infantis]
MANVALKRVDAAWDREARNNINDSFSIIEKGFNKTSLELQDHINSAAAHRSSQIKHGMYTVGNRLDNLHSRFVNLVVNHDG